MKKEKLYVKTAIWTALVWGISFVCYLPTLIENNGGNVPKVLTVAKYFFIVITLAVSMIFAASHGEFKKLLRSLFAEKIKARSVIFCVAAGAARLAFAFAYSLIADERGLFAESYPTFFSVITGSVYLFVTAPAEESAWRGYLLNMLSDSKETPFALAYTGIAWAVRHIPMWTIRNSLGIGETAVYFIRTLLLSLILGKFYLKYKNVISAALLHMLFNTCFITPVKYNVILVGCAVVVMLFIRKPNRDPS